MKIIEDLKKYLIEEYKVKDESSLEILPEICPQGMKGDLTINCFKLIKALRGKPDDISNKVFEFFDKESDVISVEKVKAFVNIVLTPIALHQSSVAQIANLLAPPIDKDSAKKILIEFSAPNTNKPQHLGHVRNNTIGMALASLMKRAGHNVIPVNLVNDRGIHICKSMIGYQRFGNNETPESTNTKGDHFVGKFYVQYNTELKKQIAELRSVQPELKDVKEDDLFLKTEIGLATQKMLQDWENKKSSVISLWEMMNAWVFKGFDETYKRMGIEFDKTFLESNTYLLGKDLIAKGLEDGAFTKREDGAVIVDLGKKLGEKVVLRSDGTSVYITQDIGTTIKKYNEFTPDQQIWVVGDEQILHFKQLFGALNKMGHKWSDTLYHLAYGMVNLPSGKMKSREGTVVDADDLFSEMVNLAKTSTLERCGDDIPADIDERSEIIGMGALKFMLLKFNPKTTISFDPQASVKFEGDTGPYVQYACARINSIIKKAENEGSTSNDTVDWELLSSDFEKNLSIRALFYPDIIKTAASKMDCSILVSYLLDLSKDFSRFYRECPVLSNSNTKEIKVARVAMCCKIRDILTDGLKTLTISVPSAM